MDRFIDVTRLDVAYDDFHLKSNMDRFIVYFQFCFQRLRCNLKSNMDRFIEDAFGNH